MSGKSRPRAPGSADDGLYQVLFAVLTNPSKVQYGEEANAKVQQGRLRENGPLLVSLRKIHENLSFSQTQMQNVLIQVADTRSWGKAMSPVEKEEMSHRVARRIRNLSAHFAAALRRKQVPKWAVAISTCTPILCFSPSEVASGSSQSAVPLADAAPADMPTEPAAAPSLQGCVDAMKLVAGSKSET